MTGADAIAVLVSALLGYVLGSLPLAALVGRMAGLESAAAPARTWRDAGPGWGLLAVTADLARGVLPVALAIVTFSWGAGLAAAIGAVAGTVWPAAGRLPGDRSLVLVLGALLVLVPVAGLIAVGGTAVWASTIRRPPSAAR
ncbi:MAG: glycerol-3-phosphate acyltransferase [Chloroflexota bacterium]